MLLLELLVGSPRLTQFLELGLGTLVQQRAFRHESTSRASRRHRDSRKGWISSECATFLTRTPGNSSGELQLLEIPSTSDPAFVGRSALP